MSKPFPDMAFLLLDYPIYIYLNLKPQKFEMSIY